MIVGLGAVISMGVVGLLTSLASAGSDSDSDRDVKCDPPISECIRENKALTYLSILDKEKLDYLYAYCNTHSSLRSNVIVETPDYVTCDDVTGEKLNRGLDSMLTKLEDLSKNPDDPRYCELFECPPKDK